MVTAHEHRTRQAIFVLSAATLAGILIWSKLRLVTDIPRSAYAEPETAQPVDPQPHAQEASETGTDPAAEPIPPSDEPASETEETDENGSENTARPNGGDAPADDAGGANATRTDAGRP